MSYDTIQTATVIRYPYLWAREARAGETEGRKERPVAVGVRLPRPDGDLVLFFPISTKQPVASRFSAEIPAIEKRRAGLDTDLRLWIILDEFNTDIVGQSFYLEPNRRSAASARPSSCRCYAPSSPGGRNLPRSAASADRAAALAGSALMPFAITRTSSVANLPTGGPDLRPPALRR